VQKASQKRKKILSHVIADPCSKRVNCRKLLPKRGRAISRCKKSSAEGVLWGDFPIPKRGAGIQSLFAPRARGGVRKKGRKSTPTVRSGGHAGGRVVREGNK